MRKYIFLFLFFILITNLSACSDIPSTSLDGITFDGVIIGADLEEVSIDNYTLTDRFPEQDNTINYEEWKITTNEDGKIVKIHANFSDIKIQINGNGDNQTIDDVIELLGENYTSGWYDADQQLKEVMYIDKNNLLQGMFIYSAIDKKLVWLIMEVIS